MLLIPPVSQSRLRLASSLTFDDDLLDQRRRPTGITQTMAHKLDLSVHDVEREAPVFVRLRHVSGQAGGPGDRVAFAADWTLDETGGRLLPLKGQS